MGLNWKDIFHSALSSGGIEFTTENIHNRTVTYLNNGSIQINLMDLTGNNGLLEQTLNRTNGEPQIIKLWEDIWALHSTKVLSRIVSITGMNKLTGARNCTAETLNKADADLFLNKHHLQGSVNAKYRLGLRYKQDIVAVATFSTRPMPERGEGYISAELIRFCSASGLTVTGGLSKLITFFNRTFHPNDIMTYADLDWSTGESYEKLGFNYEGTTDPIVFWVDPVTMQRFQAHRLPLYIMDTVVTTLM
ncbi:MAG: hypothetical protein EOO89_16980, partial [Pedobacter sp.]